MLAVMNRADDPTIGRLVADASRDLSALVQSEIRLAKSELKFSVKAGGIGAGLLAVAAFFGLLIVIMLSISGAYFLTMTGLDPAWAFLIVVNLLLLGAGMFMEPTGIILILAPILFPIAMQLGIDPVHLGIIMVVNLEIGLVTPPVGLNLFVTAGITKMSVGEVIHAALPWLLVLLGFLVVITYVPWISLALPTLLR